MEAIIYACLELFIIAILLIGLHAIRKTFGIGLLLIFLGSIQFFQTILAGNVYNSYFENIIFSPGSSIIYTSSLFGVFLVYYTENYIKTRSIVFGLVFSNIIITILSYITLEQIFIDEYSVNTVFLKEIFNFDLNLFITGTTLLFIDAALVIFIFEKLSKTIFKNIFINLFLTIGLVSIFDSVSFYSINFYQELNFSSLLIGSLIGKIVACFMFAIIIGSYVKFSNLPFKKKNIADIFFISN
jgi:hypothetical protein